MFAVTAYGEEAPYELQLSDGDATDDKMIVIGEDAEGKLDIQLIGYSGMTEAARDFIEMIKRCKCECKEDGQLNDR
jgi:hypothetical protein